MKICVFLIFLFSGYSSAIKWISIKNSDFQWNTTIVDQKEKNLQIRYNCNQLQKDYGFSKHQNRICRKSPDLMYFVKKSATLTASSCQQTFQLRRWNCSSFNSVPFITMDLTRATREQAFVYAISSAALAYTMAKACSSGLVGQCSCSLQPLMQPTNKQFKWGGCGDNVKWGMGFAKRFNDPLERNNGMKKNHHGLLDDVDFNLHNNQIGRKVVLESLVPQCKCHGMSGSCSLKTCWRALPHMMDISKKLLGKYITSVQIPFNYTYTNLPKEKSYLSQHLIYAIRSPDYCIKDEKFGSVGTKGRRCNTTSTTTDNCKQLCCGRGYRTFLEETIERCHCKYYYCCYVKCKSCLKRTYIYECL